LLSASTAPQINNPPIFSRRRMIEPRVSRYRQIGPERTDEFLAKGYKYRHVFAHRLYFLPKCGPDGFQLARQMCGSNRLDESWEIVLYADARELNQFPEPLFFDDDLCWHQQQFGIAGQIATGNLVWRGTDLYSTVHQSDLVQRASRLPKHRTRLQNRFKGWNYMLLNAILNFALEHSVRTIYTPTADWALHHTDRSRNVQRALFERIYDQQLQTIFRAERTANWWKIDVNENRHRLICPETKLAAQQQVKIICLCHDVERGIGHLDSDPDFAQAAEKTSGASLTEMLRIEKRMGIHATYNVVGQLVPSLREPIESAGHCLAFHSYDHRDFEHSSQLGRCRSIDYRLKGYRPPQSKITPELSDENLCVHNFEWLASSSCSLGIDSPQMHNRIVKIPIAFDDYELYRSGLDWETWEAQALATIRQNNFIAFSLHDCYAPFWLPPYERFLERVCALGKLQTMNDVLNRVLLSHAV
jgi:hypothetical protein